MKYKTKIKKSREEITTRGYYSENNEPRVGTGRYQDYYTLTLNMGGFEKVISTSRHKISIENEKYYLDIAISQKRKDHEKHMILLKKDIGKLENKINDKKDSLYTLENIIHMKKIISELE